ncbi:MAG: hypothetical protein SGJ20_13330 [Planctomycetota bacterium]|nr:hypothetical protein [Planctomycetota bacterium]
MQHFARLLDQLRNSGSDDRRVAVLHEYFQQRDARDAAWGLFLLTGQTVPRTVKKPQLLKWLQEESALPKWLLDQSLAEVSDLAEGVSLLVPDYNVDPEYCFATEVHRSHAAGSASFDQPPSSSAESTGEASGTPIKHLADTTQSTLFSLDEPIEQLAELDCDAALHQVIEQRLLALQHASPIRQRELVIRTWQQLPRPWHLLWHRILLGSTIARVEPRLIAQALARCSGIPPEVVAYRMFNGIAPTESSWEHLLSEPNAVAAEPGAAFRLESTQTWTGPIKKLGNPTDWLAQWTFAGPLVQLICRNGGALIWSAEGDLFNYGFPEILALSSTLPSGTVMIGQLVGTLDGALVPLVAEGSRLRTSTSRQFKFLKVLGEEHILFLANDLLEAEGSDIRGRPMVERQARLRELVARCGEGAVCRHNMPLDFATWPELTRLHRGAAKQSANGLLLSRIAQTNGQQRHVHWPVEPLRCFAMLTYAGQELFAPNEAGESTAGFAVQGGQTVAIVTTRIGGDVRKVLTDDQLRRIEEFFHNHMLRKFGPVRLVPPELVFELEFDAVYEEGKRSVLRLSRPRIVRWREDLRPADATGIDELRQLLPAIGVQQDNLGSP